MDADIHNRVLKAVQGALREEKVPQSKRTFKVLIVATVAFALFGVPFVLLFGAQMTWVWKLAFGLWAIYFGVSFYLWFKPQPRLAIPGVFSPFVIAKLFLISTAVTIFQILVCPSYVFLDSALDWNPLIPLTGFLMRVGGMNLCMLFCGFLFSAIASAVALGSIHRSAKVRDFKSNGLMIGILSLSQIPVLLVQFFTDDLRPFVGFWIGGISFGVFVVIGLKSIWVRIAESTSRDRGA